MGTLANGASGQVDGMCGIVTNWNNGEMNASHNIDQCPCWFGEASDYKLKQTNKVNNGPSGQKKSGLTVTVLTR